MKAEALSRYQVLSSDREQYLDVGRTCARLTLPYLLTEEGHTQGASFHTPWQSIGAKGVNVLASKLMLSLFPINTAFFKLQINDVEMGKIPNVTPEMSHRDAMLAMPIERCQKSRQNSPPAPRARPSTRLKVIATKRNARWPSRATACCRLPIGRRRA